MVNWRRQHSQARRSLYASMSTMRRLVARLRCAQFVDSLLDLAELKLERKAPLTTI